MTTSRGVLTIVHSHQKYAQQAINLARSIRMRDPDLPMAVVTNLEAALFEGVFDYVIPWEIEAPKAWLLKFDICKITPFDVTLYLDSDVLVFASLELVFQHFAGDDFGVVGRSISDPGFFESIDLIREKIPSATYPLFNGGLYYIVRCPSTENLLQKAKALQAQYDELKVRYTQGMKNDEALLCLAMAQTGREARSAAGMGVMLQTIWPRGVLTEVDVIAGRCIQLVDGQRISRLALHYYGGKTAHYGYVREVLRLQAAYRNRDRRVRFDLLVRIYAFWVWLMMPPLGIRKVRISIAKRLRAAVGRIF